MGASGLRAEAANRQAGKVKTNTTSKIRLFMSLRLFAALLVRLHNSSGLTYGRVEYLWQSVIVEGHAGVTIFFALWLPHPSALLLLVSILFYETIERPPWRLALRAGACLRQINLAAD